MTGNAVVLIASERRPLPAVTLTEVLATSDVPGGVVNVLTGRKRELVPVLAAHVDVDALDTWGVPDDLRTEVETLAADDIKRLARAARRRSPNPAFDWLDDRCRRAPGMDRRLPRDEDGLAPDRRLTMAVGTGGTGSRRAARVESTDRGPVERRVFVHATPRTVWATLHDPAATSILFPELRLGPAAPPWPAAATTRSARARIGLLREDARVESLEARPDSRFRLRVTASGFESEWSWRLEPVAGGTRVIHAATFEPFDRWTGILVRLGRASLATRVESHLRVLKERAEAAQRGSNPAT